MNNEKNQYSPEKPGIREEKYVIGLDYGTLSARAVLVSVRSGHVLAESVYPYPNGIYTNGNYTNGIDAGQSSPVKTPADFSLQEIDD